MSFTRTLDILKLQAKLVVVSGPEEGRAFPLRGEAFAIGRQDGNDLQLLDAAVSRRHCEVRPAGQHYALRDLESSRGSFVNSVPVRLRPLHHGDVIQVGSTTLLYLSDSGAENSSSEAPVPTLTPSSLERRPTEILDQLRETRAIEDPTSGAHLLLAISTAVQELREAEPLAERLLELLFETLPARRAAVFLMSPEAESPHLAASRGEGEFEPSRTVLTRVRGEGVAMVWDDVAADDKLGRSNSLDQIAARSLLCAPLTGRRRIHGVLCFQSDAVGAFTEAHLELVAAASGIAGLAFDTVSALDGLRQENRRLRASGFEHGMVGESAAMGRLLDFLARVAPVDTTVLLRGESGTGKELAARALHDASGRAEGPFVEINCATLSETLLESELFGHERGAFTGAVARKIGKFESASGGTLFLDEVGEIPPAVQARLLRVLQERRFERLGGTQTLEADVRVVAATNRDLEAAIREGTFREDLFYRLNVITLELPPLRERREDIALLARHFARLHGERLKRPVLGFDPTAMRVLLAYDWPGNIRQLSNAVERALVLSDGEKIRLEELPDEVLDTAARGGEESVELGDFQTVVQETKKRLLTTALAEAEGNAAAAARQLGLHPNSLRRLVRQLGLREVG